MMEDYENMASDVCTLITSFSLIHKSSASALLRIAHIQIIYIETVAAHTCSIIVNRRVK